MGLNSITAGACVWGDVYWERFGERWLASVFAANPKPDAIMILSDRPLIVPDGVRVEVTDVIGCAAWNEFARLCETTWIGAIGIDDEYTVDAFADLDTDRDAIAFGSQQRGESNALAFPAGEAQYSKTYELSNNPMNGGAFWRTSSLLEIPIRAGYIYCDEVLWAEWSYFGMRVKFDNRIRQIWHRWSGANSWPANHEAERQAQEFKAKLRAGLIQKGVPE